MNYTIYNSKLNKILCLYLTTANFSREERSEERGKLAATRLTRQFVHISPDNETAVKVGSRHGKPVILKIRARDF